ncbi:hypothetical protein SAMN04515667_0605 [Formosa sp. Hel1_31_208]|uniref:hypothetical protein n=1 Tax=Formosa sp. Hel1_31_208 TaxID=1798225 RepID=UPI00087BBC6A|nr:hypothetical protein [Formosa sp. Hel1_31_208]SDR76921.1 hypothetical protein SAMN04515667_0605 [Formosa sp. Hel1_31_208]
MTKTSKQINPFRKTEEEIILFFMDFVKVDGLNDNQIYGVSSYVYNDVVSTNPLMSFALEHIHKA